MTYKIKDMNVWEEFKLSLIQTKKGHVLDIPKRLSVSYAPEIPTSYQIDLHGLTVQEAFDKVRKSLASHYKRGARRILIITGKGTMGKGLIKNEFAGWLENPKLKEYVRSWCWQNSGGAALIHLKKKKNL